MDTIQPQPTQPTSFPQPGFYQQPGLAPQVGPIGYTGNLPPLQPGFGRFEESYIENILRLNKDKVATVYMNFDNAQWGSKVFKGAIEAAGKDHIILRDPVTNMRYLLLTIFLNYITFDEEINYQYPYAAPNIPGTGPSTQLRKKDNIDQNQTK
ncbi:spore coat protein GerQ [Mycoplasmatota bacterium]|nr:spore coat protein GerQ [Mycoplasmatota bacterium]